MALSDRRFFNLVMNKPPHFTQNLLVTTSKHLYVGADGQIKHQVKAIDPRVFKRPDAILRHYALLDDFTGGVYFETHESSLDLDLRGFFVRAWTIRPGHPLSGGIPDVLIVPKTVRKDEHAQQVLAELPDVDFGEPTSGFAAGVHTIAAIERETRRWHHLSLAACYGIGKYLSTVASPRELQEKQGAVKRVDRLPKAWTETHAKTLQYLEFKK